ncbi:hypothetical protein BGZ76_009866 [Entomortierella beljakovae]|nr:hypothetical protein BGZ76_009866 [Entomortierella beljakovae]
MKYASTITFALALISSLGSTGQAFELKVPESITLGAVTTVEWIGQPTLSSDQAVVLFDSAGTPLLTLCEGQITGSGKCSFTISQIDLLDKDTTVKPGEKLSEKYRLGFRAKNDGLTLDFSKDFDIHVAGTVQKEGLSDNGEQDALEDDDNEDEDEDEDEEGDEDESKDVEENEEPKNVHANSLHKNEDEDEDEDEDDEDEDDEDKDEDNDEANHKVPHVKPAQVKSYGKKPMGGDQKKKDHSIVAPKKSDSPKLSEEQIKQNGYRVIKWNELNMKIDQVQKKVQKIMNKLAVKATIKVNPNEPQKSTKEAQAKLEQKAQIPAVQKL